MKMAPRLIDLISKKKKTNKLHVQHTFLYFQVAVVLDDYNAGLHD